MSTAANKNPTNIKNEGRQSVKHYFKTS